VLASDYTHPSRRGHERIATLLAGSGIDPLTP
jgi:lysophospholipase L1-like esterase